MNDYQQLLPNETVLELCEKLQEDNKELTTKLNLANSLCEKLNENNEKLNENNEKLQDENKKLQQRLDIKNDRDLKNEEENERLRQWEKRLMQWEDTLKQREDLLKQKEDTLNQEQKDVADEKKAVADEKKEQDTIIQQRVNDMREQDRVYANSLQKHLKRLIAEADEIRQKRMQELIPASKKIIVALLVFAILVGYFTWWGVKLHIADYRSETEYARLSPNHLEKKFAERDGYMHYRAPYIKALVDALFIDKKDIASWKMIPEELTELSDAVRAVNADMCDTYKDKLRPIARLELKSMQQIHRKK